MLKDTLQTIYQHVEINPTNITFPSYQHCIYHLKLHTDSPTRVHELEYRNLYTTYANRVVQFELN